MRVVQSPVDRFSALVQFPETQRSQRSYPPVIKDLPDSGLALFQLPRLQLAKHTMLVQFPGPNGCTEEHIGRPSKCRQIIWSSNINGQVQKVKCDPNSVMEPAFETRSTEEVGFHLGVAHHFVGTRMKSRITAHFVTILPTENLFSVIALLLCWPPGSDDLEVRMDINGPRIYCIRIGAKLDLCLAPKYLVLEQLDRIEIARIKIRMFMAGQILQDGNLEADIMNIFEPRGLGNNRAVLAPELGPWLVYPSLQLSKTVSSANSAKIPRKDRVPQVKPAESAGRRPKGSKVCEKQQKKTLGSLEGNSTCQTTTTRKIKQKYIQCKAVAIAEEESTGAQVPPAQVMTERDREVLSPALQDDAMNSIENGPHHHQHHLTSSHTLLEGLTDAAASSTVATSFSEPGTPIQSSGSERSQLNQQLIIFPRDDTLLKGLPDAPSSTVSISLSEPGTPSQSSGREQSQPHQPLLIYSREDSRTHDDKQTNSVQAGSAKVDPALMNPTTSSLPTSSDGHDSTAVNAKKQNPEELSEAQILLVGFQHVHPGVDLRILTDWLSGHSVHNHMFFQYLEKLADLHNLTEDKRLRQNIRDAVEVVHKHQDQLVYKKQQVTLKTFCKPCVGPQADLLKRSESSCRSVWMASTIQYAIQTNKISWPSASGGRIQVEV